MKNRMKFPQKISQAGPYTTVVLVLGDLRQEDHDFEASLNNSEILFHKARLFKASSITRCLFKRIEIQILKSCLHFLSLWNYSQ